MGSVESDWMHPSGRCQDFFDFSDLEYRAFVRMEAGMTDGYARLDELLASLGGGGAAAEAAR